MQRRGSYPPHRLLQPHTHAPTLQPPGPQAAAPFPPGYSPVSPRPQLYISTPQPHNLQTRALVDRVGARLAGPADRRAPSTLLHDRRRGGGARVPHPRQTPRLLDSHAAHAQGSASRLWLLTLNLRPRHKPVPSPDADPDPNPTPEPSPHPKPKPSPIPKPKPVPKSAPSPSLPLSLPQTFPLTNPTQDYISSPKPNGYRALHTTVLVGLGVHEAGAQPLEIQIKTATMHAIAEHGAPPLQPQP